MKANHNKKPSISILLRAVLNFVKKQNESKSQPLARNGVDGIAVLNFVKKQNESKSQLPAARAVQKICCFKLCQKTK